MSKYQYPKLLYSNDFKNGFCTNLKHKLFNKYYKIITNCNFISNNYNRQILLARNNNNINNMDINGFFRDYLTIQIHENNTVPKNKINDLNEW